MPDDDDTSESPDQDSSDFRSRLGRFTVPPFVQNPKERKRRWNLPEDDTSLGPYLVELNLTYDGGLEQAGIGFHLLYHEVLGDERARQQPPVFISKSYYRCELSAIELRSLVQKDEEQTDPAKRIIYKVWPDFPVKALIDHSTITIKADAAIRAFDATGSGVVWAVVDSGIDARHIHFGPGADGCGKNKFCNTLYHPSVAKLHRDFTGVGVPTRDASDLKAYAAALDENIASALKDEFGHGTHVAGIVAGGLDENLVPGTDFEVCERVFKPSPDGQSHAVVAQGRSAKARGLRGVAPDCKLVSLKVLDKYGSGSTSRIMLALRYVREELNDDPKLLRVHGVNLSVGYDFDAEMFACGQSPICVEVDRLVKSGVVVVVAAGNTGYASISTFDRSTKVALSNTINDPGNASLAITVGSSHRDAPHTYGVSFFSSKGPTADGRLKPDLVAPGERITSATTLAQMKRLGVTNPADNAHSYIDDSGTSMSAPHVSGAIAAFLSIRREFIQRPNEVKSIFLENATSLGRERYFEGRGLLDLMRAIQSV